MLHEEWFELISAGADGQLSGVEAERLDAHLVGCEACSALLQRFERERRLHRLQAERAPSSLARSIGEVRAADAEAAARDRDRLVRRALAATAAVAAAMIAFVVTTADRPADPRPAQLASNGDVLIDAWNQSFDRAQVSVPAGTTVEWRNAGAATHHLVRKVGGTTISDDLRPGQSEEATFSAPGTYSFFCTIHPEMTGTVTVDA